MTMNLDTFQKSLNGEQPSADAGLALQALWWDAKGNWDKAHECAQAQDDAAGAWVHAYLHRKEGDDFNAGYWYRRAGKPVFAGSLQEEWDGLVEALAG
jgi:hypothetical protein